MMLQLGMSADVSTHSRLKAAGSRNYKLRYTMCVSTHSRLKAAGERVGNRYCTSSCFNTQPPEGGWDRATKSESKPRVSTHSRLKAAGG